MMSNNSAMLSKFRWKLKKFLSAMIHWKQGWGKSKIINIINIYIFQVKRYFFKVLYKKKRTDFLKFCNESRFWFCW